MTTTIKEIGGELHLVLDRELTKRLDWTPDTPVEVITDGNQILVVPVDKEQRRRRFDQIVEEVNEEWGDVLKRLAE